MGYLDKDGLAYLWTKIKAALAGKQNTITPGDGLSKDGDTLSVDIPVRDLTQAEYDALPEEQKAKGLIFLPDDGTGGGGGGSFGEVYSTEEQKIGTYYDGRTTEKLYRRVFIGTTGGTNTNNYIGVIPNLKEVVDASVIAKVFTPAVFASSGSFIGAVANYETGQVGEYHISASNYNHIPCKITIIYTKTTDPEVSE